MSLLLWRMRVEEVKIEGISCGGSLHQEGVDGSCVNKEFVDSRESIDNKESSFDIQ